MAYRTSAGSEGRVFGTRAYVRDAGQPWKQVEKAMPLRVAFRFSLAEGMVGPALGARVEEDGRALQIVTYREPSGLLRFAAWIDATTGLPRRVMMRGPGHYMVSEMDRYDEPVDITPP
jgi:hypothetical protein